MLGVTINLNVTSIVVAAAHPTASVVVELMASLLRCITSVRHDK